VYNLIISSNNYLPELPVVPGNESDLKIQFPSFIGDFQVLAKFFYEVEPCRRRTMAFPAL